MTNIYSSHNQSLNLRSTVSVVQVDKIVIKSTPFVCNKFDKKDGRRVNKVFNDYKTIYSRL